MRFAFIVLLLLGVNTSSAQQFNMPKDTWLSNLKSMMPIGFCRDPKSPFLKIYKGHADTCVAEVEQLFDHCATSEPKVVLPETLTSIPQATTLGQIMGECISAHYQGGAALDAFYRVQDMTNKRNGR